ncbi:glycosyltransferase family 2 protein [Salinibacter ruber]|uniref:glycosyltransferase family 2 protein n=1 Tax=Salinibacter ruber TaxID=146919 RepID=UPI003C6E385B
MDIAVIIPLYNGEEWIRETLDSVIEQSLPPSEIIVVDDGSTDASPSIVEGYTEVELIENKSGDGPAASRNLGCKRSSAEAVAFLDQDDLWHPDHLKYLSQSLRGSSEAPASFSGSDYIHGDEPPDYTPKTSGSELCDPWNTYPANLVGPPFLALIRRSALKSVDGWSPQYEGCSDFHLWLKLGLLGPLVSNGHVTAANRKHSSSHGADLRSSGQEVVNYYARRVGASEDVLARRRRAGLNVERYRPRLEVQKALLEYLKVLVGKEGRGLHAIARQLQTMTEDQPREVLLPVWRHFQWYVGPYAQEIGIHRYASKILDLVDCWPSSGSPFREILFDWALSHTPASDMIKRYPFTPSCWRRVSKRGYRKLRRRL